MMTARSAALAFLVVLSLARTASAAEDRLAVERFARAALGEWTARGTAVGETVFREDFSGGVESVRRAWELDPGASVADDGRGGKCLRLESAADAFTRARQVPSSFVRIAAGRPMAILWAARAPDAGAASCLRVDFYDAEKVHLKGTFGCYQVASQTDPTQPNEFYRNAEFVTSRIPEGAAYMQVYFHQPPKAGRLRADVGSVRVVDLGEAVARESARLEAIRRSRDALPADTVLAYASEDIGAAYPILGDGLNAPGEPGATLRIRECAGEMSRALVVLWAAKDRRDVRVVLPAFGSGDAAVKASAKVVKVHYQAAGAPHAMLAQADDQVLVPELLLNDDSLVRLDAAKRHDLWRTADGRYLDVNEMKGVKWGGTLPVAAFDVRDAETLRPFDIPSGGAKQIVLRFDVPRDAKPGVYRGKVRFAEGNAEIAAVPVELEVLPFGLPEAETVYDPKRRYTMGLYHWGYYDRNAKDGYTLFGKTRERYLNELATMRDNSITTPALIWNARRLEDERFFRDNLALAREAGMTGTIYLADSGFLGNSRDPAELEKVEARVRKALAVAREYGFGEVYFYGFDEAVGERLRSQLPAWRAARRAGGKVFVSGYADIIDTVGDALDLCVYNSAPRLAQPERWHAYGNRLWKYATPQSVPEDPNLFRRNYGLGIWSLGYDGGNTYCYIGDVTPWNDLAGVQAAKAKGGGCAYRAHSLAYPTAGRDIETLALCGLHEAMKDVRWMSLFRRLLRERPDAAAKAWYDAIDFDTADLAAVRRQAVDWVLRFRAKER